MILAVILTVWGGAAGVFMMSLACISRRSIPPVEPASGTQDSCDRPWTSPEYDDTPAECERDLAMRE